PDTGKFSTARWVCARHLARAGTRTSPMESCSTRYSSMDLSYQVAAGVLPAVGRNDSRTMFRSVACRAQARSGADQEITYGTPPGAATQRLSTCTVVPPER